MTVPYVSFNARTIIRCLMFTRFLWTICFCFSSTWCACALLQLLIYYYCKNPFGTYSKVILLKLNRARAHPHFVLVLGLRRSATPRLNAITLKETESDNYYYKQNDNVPQIDYIGQGRPTRGPRAIFGPPNLFEWPGKLVQFDHINWVITLTVITLSSTLCIHYKL